MRISGEIPLEKAPLLNQMGIILPGMDGKLYPSFGRQRKLSREEEDGIILSKLPPGHKVPLYLDTRARLLSQTR